MIPKIHKKGHSFAGVAKYLLHDVKAKSSDRVEWTETRNLATRHAGAAWRVMAATAMNQNQLKKAAGLPNTGRKSKQHVLHFTLSWHAEEAVNLNREEMLRATFTMLRVMKADEHQCLVVAHNDQKQPHVHVVVNRVHPKTGRMLSSSFERLKASKWAQKYEEERGKIYCVDRVVNNEARKRGEFTRGAKDLPRHLHEMLESINDNSARQQIIDQHKKWAHALKERERVLEAKDLAAMERLEASHKQKVDQTNRQTKLDTDHQIREIRKRYRPYWKQLVLKHRSEQEAFKRRESSTLGRMQNTFRSIDFAGLVGASSTGDDVRVNTISGIFGVLSSSGLRLETLNKQQLREKQELSRKQLSEEQKVRATCADSRKRSLNHVRNEFVTQRNDLLFLKSMEQAKLKAEWRRKRHKLRDELRSLEPKPVETTSCDFPVSEIQAIPFDDSDRLSKRVREIEETLARGHNRNTSNKHKR